MRRTMNIVGVVFLLVAPFFSAAAQGPSAKNAEGGEIIEGLQLLLQADTTQFEVGKPVIVQVGIRNCTPKPIDMSYTGSVTTYVFDVRREDGREVAFSKEGAGIEAMRRSANGFGLIVEPGETFWEDVDLARWYELGAPGTFSVIVSRSVQLVEGAARSTVRSKALSISIEGLR